MQVDVFHGNNLSKPPPAAHLNSKHSPNEGSREQLCFLANFVKSHCQAEDVVFCFTCRVGVIAVTKMSFAFFAFLRRLSATEVLLCIFRRIQDFLHPHVVYLKFLVW